MFDPLTAALITVAAFAVSTALWAVVFAIAKRVTR